MVLLGTGNISSAAGLL